MDRFRKELATNEADGRVLIGRVGALPAAPDVTMRGPRALLLALLFMKQPVSATQVAGLQIEGDAAALRHLIDAIDPVRQGFDIVVP